MKNRQCDTWLNSLSFIEWNLSERHSGQGEKQKRNYIGILLPDDNSVPHEKYWQFMFKGSNKVSAHETVAYIHD